MQISAINNCCPKPQFTANKNGYENPINRKTEKNLAVWTSIGSSTLVGGTAAALGSCLIGKGTKNRLDVRWNWHCCWFDNNGSNTSFKII